jgi:hypothetical protein
MSHLYHKLLSNSLQETPGVCRRSCNQVQLAIIYTVISQGDNSVNKLVIILCMNVHYSTVNQILVDRLIIWWLGHSPFHCLICTLNQSEATLGLLFLLVVIYIAVSVVMVVTVIEIVFSICKTIPVTARSKAWVCGRSLASIAGSNPAGSMDDCLFWVLYAVRQRSLRRADHTFGALVTTAVFLSVIMKPL